MRIVLIQMKVAKAIDNNFAIGTSDEKQVEVDEIAMSTIILHLSDNVFQKVDEVNLLLCCGLNYKSYIWKNNCMVVFSC